MNEKMKPSARIAARLNKKSWWLKYSQENPIKIGTLVVLSTGGLLMLGFFLHLNFMPDVDFASSTALLAAVALIGLLIFAFVSFTVVIPGVATRHFSDEIGIQVNKWAVIAAVLPALLLIAAIFLQAFEYWTWLNAMPVESILGSIISFSLLLSIGAVLYGHDEKSTCSRINRAVIFALLTPALIFCAVVLFDINLGIIGNYLANEWMIVLTCIGPILVCSGSLLYRHIKAKNKESNKSGSSAPWALAMGLWISTVLWIFGIFFTFYIFILFAKGANRSESEILSYSLLWIAFATLTNIAISTLKSPSSWKFVLMSAPLSFYLLSALSGNFFMVSIATIRTLGLGEISQGRVILTSQACNAFNQAIGGAAKCRIKPGESSGFVCPIAIKSRIGAQVLLEWDDSIDISTANTTAKPRRIAFNKSDVLAWAAASEVKSSNAKDISKSESAHEETPEQKKNKLKAEQKKQLEDFCRDSV